MSYLNAQSIQKMERARSGQVGGVDLLFESLRGWPLNELLGYH